MDIKYSQMDIPIGSVILVGDHGGITIWTPGSNGN